MYYKIGETLIKCTKEELKNSSTQYVVLLTQEEWQHEKDSFDMGIDMEPETAEIFTTRAEVNVDSLTGSFCIPDRTNFWNEAKKFAFALDERGVVFIDDTGAANQYINNIIMIL